MAVYNYSNFSAIRANCDPELYRNITYDFVEDWTYHEGQIFSITVLFPILLLLGLLGNSAFIFVVYRRPEMRTVTNWYLTNLAVADILFLVSAIVDKIWLYAKSPVPGDDSPHGPIACIVISLLADLTYFASLCFITLVSFDRFLAVRRPQTSKRRRTKNAVPTSVGCWVFAFCVAACLIPSRSKFVKYCLDWPPGDDKYKDWPLEMYVCRSHNIWVDKFINVIQTVPFFSAFALNVFLYINIIRSLDRSIQNLGHHGMSQDKNVAMRNQIAKMLVVNGVVFFCCLFPFELMCLFQVIKSLQGPDVLPLKTEELLYEISRVLAYINSVANPLIYTLLSHRYRASFKAAFMCRGNISQRGSRRTENDAAHNNEFRTSSLRGQNATRDEIL
ncbi:somatostatin receptor type 5-like [Asterias rubens]|uniref:somatostatin receptor type 5-like n=1 Tax=Asterias rubens TaxID=7604 RepID=UPI001455DB3E|nr:somatostatin receptor type 5-like [Asterias rubens]